MTCLTLSTFSPADFVIDAVSVDYHSVAEEAASKASIDRLVLAWREEQGATDKGTSPPPKAPDAPTGQYKLRKTPFSRAFPVVLGRSFR